MGALARAEVFLIVMAMQGKQSTGVIGIPDSPGCYAVCIGGPSACVECCYNTVVYPYGGACVAVDYWG